MLQSTHFDPVLGLDIHIVTIPMPAPVPVPIPMPFVGMVFEPAGIIMGAAMGMLTGGGPGIVLVNKLPATNCGTDVTNKLTLPHLPLPGVSFVPPPMPANDALLYFGSNQVSLAGSFGVRLGDVALSCSTPVRLPTSVVLAIPKGPPVLNKAPMVPDLNAIGMALAMKGVMKGLGKAARGGAALFRRFRGGALAKRLSKVLGGCVPPNGAGRLRQMWSRAVRFVTGHPVDVVTGNVFTSVTDVELPGPLPLVIERVYESAGSRKASALGHGWNHTLDESLWMERGRAVVRCGDGRELEFPLWDLPDRRMRRGDVLESALHKMTLRCLGAGRFEVEQPDGRVHELAPVPGAAPEVARLTRIRSRDGHHSIELTYDERGRLEMVRDCGGRLLYFEHDDRGRLVRLKLPQAEGRGWYVHREYIYNARGDLVEVKDALGKSWRYQYQTHLLVQETDRAGLSFYFQYDGVGSDARCVRTWGDGGIYDHLIHYDVRNKVTVVTNSLGHKTTYFANAMGQVVKVLDAHGGATRYEYDEALQKVAEVDPLGNATRYEYDARGNQTKKTDPDGAAVAVEYDDRRLPVRAVDEIGGEWRWAYDAGGNVTEEVNPLGEKRRYEYADGLLSALADAAGRRTSFAHDSHKNLASLDQPNGAKARFEYDRLGRLVHQRTVRGGDWRVAYDEQGRVLRIENPTGEATQWSYDAEGNLLELRSRSRHVRFGYTGFHRPAWREEDGARVALSYDSEGRLTGLSNEAGERHLFALDALGRPVSATGFDGAVRRFQYDAAGRIKQVQQPDGRKDALVYDAAGRLVERRNGDGTFQRYRYRPDGALVGAVNEAVGVILERDGLGRVVLERQGEHSVTSRYGTDGLRSLVETSLGGRQAILRDALGEAQELHLGAGRTSQPVIRFERDEDGLETVRRLPGGVRIEWRQDRQGRPTSRRTLRQAPSGEAHALTYRWGSDGQLRELEDSKAGTTTYAHDARGRLVREERPDATQHRAMDAVGNVYRTAEGRDRRYGPGGRLEVSDGVAYQHDASGNLVQKRAPDGTAWELRWGGTGMLREVRLPDGRRVRFEYDAFARRTRKTMVRTTENGEETVEADTVFVWDGNVVIHELSGPGALTTWYWEPESFAPVAREAGGRCWPIATDHLGTPTEMYDEEGRLACELRLTAFGEGSGEAALQQLPWRWPGQYADAETGLYYNRFRYYDAWIGRYISPDPLDVTAGPDRYGYAADPKVAFDPWALIIVYHYTDKAGFDAITANSKEWVLKASSPPGGRPFGAYVTTMPPTSSASDLARMRIPAEKRAYYIAIDVADDKFDDLVKNLPGGRGAAGISLYFEKDISIPRILQNEWFKKSNRAANTVRQAGSGTCGG